MITLKDREKVARWADKHEIHNCHQYDVKH